MISVLIATVGEARREHLNRCLESVWSQGIKVEVLVGSYPNGRPNQTYNHLCRSARNPTVLVLNDDCILQSGFLEACEEADKDPSWTLGVPYLGTPGDPHVVRYQWSVPYACFPLFRKLNGLTLFDEAFPFYYVDQDLAFRVLEKGLKMIPIPGACVYHEAAPSPRRGNPHDPDASEGWTIFSKRWYTWQDEARKRIKEQIFPETCSGRCR